MPEERDVGYVFLDRDGTINLDTGYLVDPEKLELLPGAATAIGELRRAGFRLVIVSNQSAIGRGIGTAADVDAVNVRLVTLLQRSDRDAIVELIFYCPHGAEDGCSCRKPLTGMVELLHGVTTPGRLDEDLARKSWMVGDKRLDVEFGVNLGLPPSHCFQLLGESKSVAVAADGSRLAPDLATAARVILSECLN